MAFDLAMQQSIETRLTINFRTRILRPILKKLCCVESNEFRSVAPKIDYTCRRMEYDYESQLAVFMIFTIFSFMPLSLIST